ncbi:MAG: PhnD/SsuA/transferrin family substrate-binding protein [Phototrophicaceae bacterium]
MRVKGRTILEFSMLWVLWLTACQQQQVLPFFPTPTPDLLQFYEPTPISPGNPANPLQLIFVVDNIETAGVNASQVAERLQSQSGVALNVVLSPTTAQAVEQLCNLDGDNVHSAIWVHALAATIAEIRNCGRIALQGVLGDSAGMPGQIIATAGLSTLDVEGKRFCRLALDDFYSWVLPSMVMQVRGVDSSTLIEVENQSDWSALVSSVNSGLCDFAGVPANYKMDSTLSNFGRNTVLVAESPAMPFGMLVYPPQLLPQEQQKLTAAFLQGYGNANASVSVLPPFDIVNTLASDRGAFYQLTGADSVQLADESQLMTLRDYVLSSGLDFRAIGE